MRFLFLGDSLTSAGRNESLSASDLGQGYVYLLQKHWQDQGLDWQAVNFAFNGARLHHLASDIRPLEKRQEDFDVISLLIGSNDVMFMPDQDLADYQERIQVWKRTYRNLFQHLTQEYQPKLFVGLEPIGAFPSQQNQDRLAILQEAWSQVLRECGGTPVYIHQVLMENVEENFLPDRIHLDQAGHQVIAQILDQIFQERLH